GRLPPDGRALPYLPVPAQPSGAHGPPGRLVQRLFWCTDVCRAAVRAVPEAISSVSTAVDNGEQRQARYARCDPSRLSDQTDLLGRTGNERPALVLPDDPSGDQTDSLRFHRIWQAAEPRGPAPRHAPGQRLRAGRSAGFWEDARASQGRGHSGLARTPP